jgi:hypothetical protein
MAQTGGAGYRWLTRLPPADLAGPAWLDANASDPAVDAFTTLHAACAPPGPGSPDQILAAVI